MTIENEIKEVCAVMVGVGLSLKQSNDTFSYPSHTNLIKEKVDIYIKDGVCIKNRGGRLDKDLTFVIEKIIENDLKEIAIETDGLLKIYTKDSDRYKNTIKYLIDSYGLSILEKIKIITIK